MGVLLRNSIRALLLIVCIAVVARLNANVISSDSIDRYHPYSIHRYVTFFSDTAGQTKFDRVYRKKSTCQFEPIERKEVYLDFDDHHVWLHFTLRNDSYADKSYLLQIPNPSIDSIQLYWEHDSLVKKHIATGDIFPHRVRELAHHDFIFKLDIEAKGIYNCYIEISNRGDAIHFPIYINTFKDFVHQTSKDLIKIGAFIGMVIFLIIISFITLYSHLQERTFYYFVFYLISGALFLLTLDGISFQFFWPEFPAFNNISKLIFSELLCIFLTFFAINFLELELVNKLILRVLQITAFVLVLITLLLPFDFLGYALKIRLTLMSTVIATVIIISSSILVIRFNSRHAIFFLLAFFPYIIGVIYFSSNVFAGLADTEFRSDLMKICLILQMVIFYVALSDRIKAEKQKMQLKLQVSEKKYKDILNNAVEAIFVAQDDNIVFANRKFTVFFHQKPTKRNQVAITSIAEPEYQESLKKIYVDLIRGGGKSKSLLFKSTSFENKTIWYEITSVYINWEKRPATLNFLTDVTAKIEADEDRKRLELQLRHSQKLETIGTLAGGIAHDFNNILTPIIGYSEMALDHLDDESDLKADIQSIFQSANRAKDLVKQILTFSRQIDVDKEVVGVKDIVEETASMLRATLPSTIKLNVNNSSPDAKVNINKTQIHQVLMNICTNAYQAITSRHGEITLGVNYIDVNEVKNIPQNHELDKISYICVTISDTGTGIERATLNRIFEPFFTTKSVGEGTGLGLSVAHGIVKNNGGEIFVDSEVDEGTTFSIYLPAYSNSQDELLAQTLKKITGSEKIAILDDETSITKMIAKMLSDLGYKVDSYNSAVEIIEHASIDSKRWDLIITDMTMPDITGVDLAKEIHKLEPDLKVLIMTGNLSVVKEQIDSNNNIDVIGKPIAINELSSKIREVLEQ